MTLSAKDTIEATSPVAERGTSPAGTQPRRTPGHLRSDAVSLEIPIRVHGSRVTDVARGVAPQTEPFEEQTTTMIVFPQGGVLRMSTAVSAGQMLVVTNLKSRQDAICRIVKVRSQANTAGYVEVEFTQRQPGYWGVYFPSDDADATKASAPPAAPAPEQLVKENGIADTSWGPGANPVAGKPPDVASPSSVKPAVPAERPSVAPTRVGTPSKPQSAFISIGSQENVHPAAESTRTKSTAPVKQSPAPPAPTASLSVEELLGDLQPGVVPTPAGFSTTAETEKKEEAVIPVERPARKRRTTSRPTAPSPSVNVDRSFAADVLGRLEGGVVSREDKRGDSQKWILVAGIAVVALACAAGGYFFLHHRSDANRTVVAARPAVQSSATPATVTVSEVAQPEPAVTVTPKPAQAGHPNAPAPSAAKAKSSDSAARPTAAASPVQQAAAKPPAPSIASDMFGTLNAHPVSAPKPAAPETNAAPVVAPAVPPDASGALAAIPSASAAPALPTVAGGKATQPRLISSVQPTYPPVAMQMHSQGDVVIQALIDPNGKVADMKVISGPALLRSAARDALRKWKYEPGTLDGRPVPVQIQVTIRFRL